MNKLILILVAASFQISLAQARETYQGKALQRFSASQRFSRLVAFECGDRIALEQAWNWQNQGDHWIQQGGVENFFRTLKGNTQRLSPFTAQLILGSDSLDFTSNHILTERGSLVSGEPLPQPPSGCYSRLLAMSASAFVGDEKKILVDESLFRRLPVPEQSLGFLLMRGTNENVLRTIFDVNTLKLSELGRLKLFRARGLPTAMVSGFEILLFDEMMKWEASRLVAAHGVIWNENTRRYSSFRITFNSALKVRELSSQVNGFEFDSYRDDSFGEIPFPQSPLRPQGETIKCPHSIEYDERGEMRLCFMRYLDKEGRQLSDENLLAFLYSNKESFAFDFEHEGLKRLLNKNNQTVLSYDPEGPNIIIRDFPRPLSQIQILDSFGHCRGIENLRHESLQQQNGKYQVTIKIPRDCTILSHLEWGKASPTSPRRPLPNPRR